MFWKICHHQIHAQKKGWHFSEILRGIFRGVGFKRCIKIYTPLCLHPSLGALKRIDSSKSCTQKNFPTGWTPTNPQWVVCGGKVPNSGLNHHLWLGQSFQNVGSILRRKRPIITNVPWKKRCGTRRRSPFFLKWPPLFKRDMLGFREYKMSVCKVCFGYVNGKPSESPRLKFQTPRPKPPCAFLAPRKTTTWAPTGDFVKCI